MDVAVVDSGEDAVWPDVLVELSHLRVARVLAVWYTCQGVETDIESSTTKSAKYNTSFTRLDYGT